MILRPLTAPAPVPGVVAVWAAVEATQKRQEREWWVITQPDHAALSGELAARLGPPLMPQLSPQAVRGIALHDAGWTEFDRPDAPAMSFLEAEVGTFLRAWTGSIERAQAESAIGGALVSKHFWRIGQARLQGKPDTAENDAALRGFLERESGRQERLLRGYRGDDPDLLTDVLQFCDLLSLYLCCGAEEEVEFPQSFSGQTIRLERVRSRVADSAASACRLSPSPFTGGGSSLAVPARRWPQPAARTLPFLLW